MFFFGKQNINEGVKECRATPGAVLIDVREREEFLSGHIPGAVNVPLSAIGTIRAEKNAPLYLYCLRGTRSRQAAGALRRMGYKNVKSIGGITQFADKLER